MYNEMLDRLIDEIEPNLLRGRAALEATIGFWVSQAIADAKPNGYLEDSIGLIDKAVEQLFSDGRYTKGSTSHLIGAIEALRDELHLCQIRVAVRPIAMPAEC